MPQTTSKQYITLNLLPPSWISYDHVWLCNFSGTLCLGFYGNEEMKKGDNSMSTAASEAEAIVVDIRSQVLL